MKLHIKPTSQLNGAVTIPGSKSQSVRGLLFALAARGESTLTNVVDAKDTEAAISVLEAFGAKVEHLHKDRAANGWTLKVDSPGPPFTMQSAVNSGNSGITTRFMMPLAGLANSATWDCGEQMKARPITPLIDALNAAGMKVSEHWPRDISGELKGGDLTVDGTTSQYLSALLMTLPYASENSTIRVKNLQERPYIEMSLQWLREQNLEYKHKQEGDWDIYEIPGGQSASPIAKHIPGDWSSASYPLAAAALLPGTVELHGLDPTDQQGDKALLKLLQNMGAKIEIEEGRIIVHGGATLTGQVIDCSQMPDMLPTIAVLATQAEGETRIINCAHARIKETDRIHSMHEGLSAMGAKIQQTDDGLIIQKSKLKGATVKGYDDHRTIMALALAGLFAEGETIVTEAEGISKTFPNFVRLMRSLGAHMHMTPITMIGFKHTGKSSVGKATAKAMNLPFRDLDDCIEAAHGTGESCREIVRSKGEQYFRELETQTLRHQIEHFDGVLALGGGAAKSAENQALLTLPTVVHMTAPKEKVFQWIAKKGKPSYYGDGDFYEEFSSRWDKTNPLYAGLADFTVTADRPAKDSAQVLIDSL